MRNAYTNGDREATQRLDQDRRLKPSPVLTIRRRRFYELFELPIVGRAADYKRIVVPGTIDGEKLLGLGGCSENQLALLEGNNFIAITMQHQERSFDAPNLLLNVITGAKQRAYR